MSLITRCPVCNTAFKVVPDQLKVSQGWVRCGHCAEVFDASRYLMPQETVWHPSSLPVVDEPVNQTTISLALSPAVEDVDAAAGAIDASNASMQPGDDAIPISKFPTNLAPLKVASATLVISDIEHESATDFGQVHGQQSALDRRQNELPVTVIDTVMVDMPPALILIHEAVADSETPTALSDNDQSGLNRLAPAIEASRPDADVSFIREARRKAFRDRPQMRWAIAFLSLILAAGLMLQLALQQRDTWVAMEPRAEPALRVLCKYFHCEIHAVRRIDSMVIDGSTFTRIGPDAYRLKFSLKNTQNTPLQIPHLEFTLTDTQDRAVVRRVLTPAQFGAKDAILPGQAELAGPVTIKVFSSTTSTTSTSTTSAAIPLLSASAVSTVSITSPASFSLSVTGYRILVFYPN